MIKCLSEYLFTELFCVFLTAGAQACAVVFSTVDRDSFEAVEKWRSKVQYLDTICTVVHFCFTYQAIMFKLSSIILADLWGNKYNISQGSKGCVLMFRTAHVL